MKRTTVILVGLLALSACTNYQGPKANCFDDAQVTRSANNFMSIAASDNVVVSTRNDPVKNCSFETLGAPAGTGGQ